MFKEQLELNNILKWTSGTLLQKHNEAFDWVGTDTRTNLSDKLFIALRGDNFDAHHFLSVAVGQGATGLLIDSEQSVAGKELPGVTIILVSDTLKALQEISYGYRSTLATKIIAITGSSGKTTAKEFSYQIIKTCKSVYANKGSFNNHWGVPLTLLNIKRDNQVAIVEMGMNHFHELENLVKIGNPDIVCCTMVGTAHIEHFRNQDNIAKAKYEIYEHASEQALRVYNLDNPWTLKMYEKDKSNFLNTITTFSQIDTKADVNIKLIRSGASGLEVEGHIKGQFGNALVPIIGAHNITNINAAATLSWLVGVPADAIWKALNQLRTSWGRNQILRSANDVQIIFDGYNANLDSMKGLLETINTLKENRSVHLALAELLEVGDKRSEYHIELGKLASLANPSSVSFYGKSFKEFKKGFESANKKTELLCSDEFDSKMWTDWINNIPPGSLLGIKGSRGMKTERVVQLLVQTFAYE